MGIGRTQARAALAAIKAGTTRATMRLQVAESIEVMQGWLIRRDAQDAAAEAGFAASRPAQFDTFVDSLPEVPVDQTP